VKVKVAALGQGFSGRPKIRRRSPEKAKHCILIVICRCRCQKIKIHACIFPIFHLSAEYPLYGSRDICCDGHSKFPMATQSIARYARPRTVVQVQGLYRVPVPLAQPQCFCRYHKPREFSSSTKLYKQRPEYKDSFGTRLRKALGETKIKWYPIPVGVGIGFLGLVQFYRINEREKARRADEEEEEAYLKTVGRENGDGSSGREGRPKRRERIRPTGPWFVPSESLPSEAIIDIYIGRSKLCQHCR
jgi:hypothetical protein